MKTLTPDQAEKIRNRKKELEQNKKNQNKPDNKSVKVARTKKPNKSTLKDKNPLKTSLNALQDPINDNTTVEHVKDSGDVSIQEIENRIYTALYDFMDENNMNDSDLIKARQLTWNALCMYIGKKVFKNTQILKVKECTHFTGAQFTNDNKYDLNKVISVLSIYEYLLTKYNKVFTAWTASLFCGMDDGFLSLHAEELTALGYNLSEKRETSLQDNITDGRINPTGSIAILNNKFSWGQDNSRNITNNIESVVVYPSLQMNDHNNDIKAIPEKP